MEIEAAIVAKLKADAGINALVGGRIAAAGIPDTLARPNIAYQRIGTGRRWSNDGPSGLARATLQLSCYADTYPQAKALAKAVRAFDGFAGRVGAEPPGDGVTIQSMFLDDEQDAPAPPPAGQTRSIPGIVLVFVIAYSE